MVMSGIIVWFVLAAALLVAEMLTGTFYLLMIAVGCAVAGVAAWLGAGAELQLVVGAAVGIALTVVLRNTRWGKLKRGADAATDRNVILDIGEVVQVDAWNGDTALVRYRGCQWHAQLEPGALQTVGAQVIKAVRGSTLVVAPAP